ncbi:hypothetical protein KP509_02G082000 [Ceratopteris richardii]|uniref:Uncharacterized protein n=1 Tax=Ceratopteris richardii TaxID=49495 RepID=A0A8T2VEV4_CERRI|nr:hypothetical protein KP509_02G082000 [Ceratopteris richardii]
MEFTPSVRNFALLYHVSTLSLSPSLSLTHTHTHRDKEGGHVDLSPLPRKEHVSGNNSRVYLLLLARRPYASILLYNLLQLQMRCFVSFCVVILFVLVTLARVPWASLHLCGNYVPPMQELCDHLGKAS